MSTFLRWLPALTIMAVIYFLSSRTAAQLPHFGAFDYVIKKSGHALGYGLLGIAYYYALPSELPRHVRWPLAWLFSFGFAVTDELHQYFVSGRTSSAVDVGIDLYGATLFLIWGAGWEFRSGAQTDQVSRT